MTPPALPATAPALVLDAHAHAMSPPAIQTNEQCTTLLQQGRFVINDSVVYNHH